MKALFVLLFFVLPVYVFAQTDAAQYKQKHQYCMVTVETWGTHREIIVDYGQTMSRFRDEKLKDAGGKVMKFNSNPEVLNYMDKLGWELVTSDMLIRAQDKISGTSDTVVYTFKRSLQ